MEIWKDIKGYEGKYQVCTDSRVKSLERKTRFGNRIKIIKERICTPHLFKVGYYMICFGGNKRKYLHRIMAEAFIPNPENKPCVNHKNGIKTDDRIENLEWCTYGENTTHAFKSGLNKGVSRFGDDNPFCKIPFEKILQIRAQKGKQTLAKSAEAFGISLSHVWQIQSNKNRINK